MITCDSLYITNHAINPNWINHFLTNKSQNKIDYLFSGGLTPLQVAVEECLLCNMDNIILDNIKGKKLGTPLHSAC